MPIADGRADVVRRIEGLSGTVRMRHEWIVRFGYGKVRPWVTRRRDKDDREVISAIAGPDMLVLRGTRLPIAADGMHVDEFDVPAGEVLTFTTTWFHSLPADPADARRRRHGSSTTVRRRRTGLHRAPMTARTATPSSGRCWCCAF